MCAGGAIQGLQTWTDIRLRCTMVRVKGDATSAGGVGESLLCFCCFASRGRLVNHACRLQVRPQPRILVRDRDYDDSTLDPPPIDPQELNEVYNTNWSSIRSSRYNRRY